MEIDLKEEINNLKGILGYIQDVQLNCRDHYIKEQADKNYKELNDIIDKLNKLLGRR